MLIEIVAFLREPERHLRCRRRAASDSDLIELLILSRKDGGRKYQGEKNKTKEPTFFLHAGRFRKYDLELLATLFAGGRFCVSQYLATLGCPRRTIGSVFLDVDARTGSIN